MRKLFYLAAVLLVLFELANVWFIMPLPFSQRMQSIDVAYQLHVLRWIIRGVLGAVMLATLSQAWQPRGWRRGLVPLAVAVVALVTYATNFVMAADQMFVAPASLSMQPASRNVVDTNRLVVGIEVNGEARAYPVQFIGYHHQVRDTVAGKPVMVSFCTVCRTGRVFDPVVDGSEERFRLVGMDHFNAMFEDATTKSWWRQANGEAIAGPRAGKTLAEIPSRQVTLAQWLALHPASLIMQPDSALSSHYSQSFDFETGASRGTLTGTDTVSWRDKAWVVGITTAGRSRAYDWNRLRREGVINDVIGDVPIVLALAGDRASFFAFVRPDAATRFTLRGDSLVAGARTYALTGVGAEGRLQAVNASQEFWHSWRTFQPQTSRY
ncbi:MAG: DUF3179 domain-containing (seleno)protein [Gemmatimonadaceae bacterium]